MKKIIHIFLFCLIYPGVFAQPTGAPKIPPRFLHYLQIKDSLAKLDSILQKQGAAKLDSTAALPIDSKLVISQKNSAEHTIKTLPFLKNAATEIDKVTTQTIFTASNIVISLLVLTITWLLIRLAKKILEKFAERSTKHRITIKGFIPIVSIILWVMVVYVIVIDIFSPPRETLFAAMASIGLAVGFAAQDIIKNIFAGLVIIFDSPFKVGDKIEVGSHYGEVLQIGLRSTKIVTPDDSMVTLPNSEMMNNSVSNSNTGEANCQVVAEIFLPPNIDTIKVRQIAIEAAQVSKYIYLNKPITVLFFNAVEDGIPFYKMRLKAYVMDIRAEFVFKSDMTELVMAQLFKEEILDETYFTNHDKK